MRPELESLIQEEMAGHPLAAHDPAFGLPLVVSPYGADEVVACLEVLLSTRVTMGERVRAFESAWASYCGRSHGVMVNSGSSANLLMLAALVETGQLSLGDEILVPAVTWSTSLFPVFQAGLVPVMVDVDPETLCADPASVRAAAGPRTKGILAVHLLGQPADMDAFDGLMVLEDACGAHGAVYRGRRVGGIGTAAAFSFFFSHHITTIEGGMVVTDDGDLADAMRSLRAHGWVRERSDREILAARSPEIDPRFLFVSAGYNLRPTELAGAFGLVQLTRLPAWVERRRANHAAWCKLLEDYVVVFPEARDTEHAGFAFPMLVDGDRAAFQRALEARRIETRPISGSNLARQPAFRNVLARTPVPLPVSDRVHTQGLFVGNSHAFGPGHGELLADAIRTWSQA